MKVSIMITTLSRVEHLQHTLGMLESLDSSPFEVWVVADGCMDSTVETVRNMHTAVRLIVHETSKGSVASRAEVMGLVGGDLVLALDDDSYPEQLGCLKTLQDLFEQNPNLAIATFPQRTDEYPDSLTQQNFGEAHAVRSFPCSGACLRVSTYRSLQGFEPIFFHMYEEPDYALQCVAAGWDVLYTPAITIRHHWTGSGRSELRNHHRHARNELWSTLIRCPFPQMLVMITWRVFSQARFAASRDFSWLIREPLWWWDAIKGIPQVLHRRHPVSWAGYKKWLSLP